MIGTLVKKDLTYLTTALKSTVLSIVILGLFLPMGGIGFGIAMPALVCYIGFYSILAYEERSKMQLLNASLPVTRKEICLAKYILAFLMIIFTMVLSTAGTLLRYVIDEKLDIFMAQLPLYITLMGVAAFIYIAIMLPCIFYFGTMKARYVMMGIYIFTFILATNMNMHKMPSLSGLFQHSGSTIILLWTVSIVSCLISIGISLKIWQKKDIN